MSDEPPTRSPWEVPLVFATFAALYLSTASRHLLGGDAGEFATIFAAGGTAHPPGYPLYSMYLRALSWIPAASPAHGASLATALLGAAAIAALYTAARDWGCDRLEAAFAAVAAGLAPEIWLYHTSPEAFALNNLIAAAILWTAAPRSPLTGTARVALLGLLAGLGLANHHTIVLTAPLGLWGVYRGATESDRHAALAVGAGALALAAGLLPYGYLSWVAGTDAWHWADPETLSGVADVFLRRDYGTFRMTAGASTAEPLAQVAVFAEHAPLDLYVLPVLVAAAGLFRLARRASDDGWTPRHSYATALAASMLVAGPLFATLLTIDPEGVGLRIVRRFHLLPELQLALLGALGAAALRDLRPSRRLATLVVAALAVAAIPRIWQAKRLHHAPTVDQYVRDTFDTLPDRAVVLGTGDHNFFGAMYLRRALDRKPNLQYVDAYLLVHDWYRDRVDARLDLDLPDFDSTIDTDTLLEALTATDRPVYVTDAFTDGLLDGWRATPRGTTIRIHGPRGRPPTPLQVYRRNEKLFRNFSVHVPPDLPDASWAHLVLRDYASTWTRIADALRHTDHPTRARRATHRARAFQP